MDTVAHKGTLIVIRFQFISVWELGAYPFRFNFHISGECKQIDAGLFHQVNQYGILTISVYFKKFLLFLYLHFGKVPEAYDTLPIVADDNLLQFFQAIYVCR